MFFSEGGFARRGRGGAGNVGVGTGVVFGFRFGVAGIEGDFPVREAHKVEPGSVAGEVVGLAFFESKDLRIVARLTDDIGSVEHALERFPIEWIAQIGIEGDVDAGLGPAGSAAGAVEQNDVLVEVRVVVDGRTPMGIGVFRLPGASCGEDGAELAAKAGFVPLTHVELLHFAWGGCAVFKGHAGGGDSLRSSGAGVVGEEEVEEFVFTVEDDAGVAVATGEEAVFGIAIDGVARFENDAEIVDGGSVITRNCGTDFGSGEVAPWAAQFRLVVVEEEECAVFITPDGFKPDGTVFGGIENDLAGIAQIELVGAAADVWNAGGMEEVHDAIGPEGGAVAVDDGWELDAGSESEGG